VKDGVETKRGVVKKQIVARSEGAERFLKQRAEKMVSPLEAPCGRFLLSSLPG
jgi:hypothetical protein